MALHRTTLIAAAALLMGGCGTSPAPAPGPGEATVFAASSLSGVLPAIRPGATYSFGGSDRLAFQIRQGAPADVFASANRRYPDELFAQGLVERPTVFALNRLVVLVPAANPAGITGVADLARPGVRLALGDASVPVGDAARRMLARLRLRGALGNVVSNAPDVGAVVTAVTLGEVDAGVAYRTDARAAGARVRAIAIPSDANPPIAYAVAVSTSAPHPAAARAFVSQLTGAAGRRRLVRFGFGVPPP